MRGLHEVIVFTENRAGPSNLGNVISQILLCKTIAPDFNQEEICSIAKDSLELNRIVHEMQEFLPQQEVAAGEKEFYSPVLARIFRLNILADEQVSFLGMKAWG